MIIGSYEYGSYKYGSYENGSIYWFFGEFSRRANIDSVGRIHFDFCSSKPIVLHAASTFLPHQNCVQNEMVLS